MLWCLVEGFLGFLRIFQQILIFLTNIHSLTCLVINMAISLLTAFFFNAFMKDFSVLIEEYSRQMNTSFFQEVNAVTYGNIFPLVFAIYEDDSFLLFEKVLNLRVFSLLSNFALKDKVFYFLLKFFIGEEHKLFII